MATCGCGKQSRCRSLGERLPDLCGMPSRNNMEGIRFETAQKVMRQCRCASILVSSCGWCSCTMFALFESETSERSADGACGGCSGPSADAAASPGGSAGQPSLAATVKLLERAAELYSQVDKHFLARCLFGCNVEVVRRLENVALFAV